MTQMEFLILVLGMAKTFAFPVGAVAIAAALYATPKLLDRWTRRVWNLR